MQVSHGDASAVVHMYLSPLHGGSSTTVAGSLTLATSLDGVSSSRGSVANNSSLDQNPYFSTCLHGQTCEIPAAVDSCLSECTHGHNVMYSKLARLLYTAARETRSYRIAMQNMSLFRGGMRGVSANSRRHKNRVKPCQTLKICAALV